MKNKKYIMYLVVSILVLTIGVSYAYFKARVSGEGKSISLRSKGIYVLYSGDATLASESISPGWSVTKEFTVENQGSNNEVYNIYIEGLVNTFVTSGYLQYKITSSNGYNMSEYKDIPKSNTSTDTVLAYSVPIKSKEKQTYKVELIYKETEEDQSIDMGKILSGILGIQVGTKDPNLFTASVVVINGSSDTNSKEVYKGNDVTFTITPNDGYTLENASISCSNGTLSNNLLTISNVQSDVTCTITLGEDSPYEKGTLAYQILQDNPTVKTRTDFSVTNTETTTGTIYVQSSTATSMMTEDIDGDGIGEDTYYFSGNHEKNWVKFGEFYWRIVRINEDGSVRMLLTRINSSSTGGYAKPVIGYVEQEKTEYSPSPDGWNDLRRVGYMYGPTSATTLQSIRTNTIDSTVKTFIDTWYKARLLNNYDKYISKTAIYCNDRSVGSGTLSFTSYSFAYASNVRISTNKTPSYKCGSNGTGGLFEANQAVEDKFSVSTASGGNGQLTYPIALMTADEVVFAGGVYGTTLSSTYAWFYTDGDGKSAIGYGEWWTMSAYSIVDMYIVTGADNNDQQGGSISYNNAGGKVYVRPVISLKACVKYSSGDGSSSNPYQVTIDSTCESNKN